MYDVASHCPCFVPTNPFVTFAVIVFFLADLHEGHPSTLRPLFTDQTQGGTGEETSSYTISPCLFLVQSFSCSWDKMTQALALFKKKKKV